MKYNMGEHLTSSVTRRTFLKKWIFASTLQQIVCVNNRTFIGMCGAAQAFLLLASTGADLPFTVGS